jgi:hypothetical protein
MRPKKTGAKGQEIKEGTEMTMKFVPRTRKIIVNLSDGMQFIVGSELLITLGSGLGQASREAMDHPLRTILIDNLLEIRPGQRGMYEQ